MFCGGTGAATIASALSRESLVDLTLVINAYDDGLSTGRIRELIPGMLGPSDVRKNFSNLLRKGRNAQPFAADLLERRIEVGRDVSRESRDYVRDLESAIISMTDELTVRQSRQFVEWARVGIRSLSEASGSRGVSDFHDMAVGNVVFAGTFRCAGDDFNAAVDAWSQLFRPGSVIMNVTDGADLVLVGLTEDGRFLKDEASIVGMRDSGEPIVDVFLLNRTDAEAVHASYRPSVDADEIRRNLDLMRVVPSPNPSVLSAVGAADVIIYGPGTQHASLLPSYMTAGLGDAICRLEGAPKLFVANLDSDNDITNESVSSLLRKLERAFRVGSPDGVALPGLVTGVLSHLPSTGSRPWGIDVSDEFPSVPLVVGQWKTKTGRHNGDRVTRTVMTLTALGEGQFDTGRLTPVSIIVPVLDEARTLGSVLNDLLTQDWLGSGFLPEIVVVDGGSRDGSQEIAAQVPGVRLLALSAVRGRGEAIREGIGVCSGELLLTFPADGEYQAGSLLQMAEMLRANEGILVFGSRSTFCVDSDAQLRMIYAGVRRQYLVSKWGGVLLTLCSGLLYRRWVSDPLTSLKGMRRGVLERVSLRGDTLDWDLRLIIDAWRGQLAIAEIAVPYYPRTRAQGKKTRLRDGLRALRVALSSRWRVH